MDTLLCSDVLANRFGIRTLCLLGACSKTLYDGLGDEYYKAYEDVYIYTRSRKWTTRMVVWGRGWDLSYLDLLLSHNERYLQHGRTRIHNSTISYEHSNGTTRIRFCEDVLGDEDHIGEFLYRMFADMKNTGDPRGSASVSYLI